MVVGEAWPDPAQDRFGAQAVLEGDARVEDGYHLLYLSADRDLEDEDLTARCVHRSFPDSTPRAVWVPERTAPSMKPFQYGDSSAPAHLTRPNGRPSQPG